MSSFPLTSGRNRVHAGYRVLNTVGSSNVFLSENASFSATGSGFFGIGDGDVVRQTWFDTLREEPGYDTMIPLHDACIDIACRVIENRPACRIDDEANISSLEYLHRLLQDLFHNKEWEDSEARNDLLELCTSSNMYGPRSVMGLGRLEWWGGQYEVWYNPIVIEAHRHRSGLTSYRSSTRTPSKFPTSQNLL